MELSDTCMQVVLDAIPSAALVVDAADRIVLKNKIADKLLALRPDDIDRRLPDIVAAFPVDVTPMPGGALVVLRDNGDRESVRRFEQLESLAGIGEIAAGAIHEIRNPLTSISGFIQLIMGRARRHNDQSLLDYCTLIAEEIGHINGILSDFLTLAKSPASKFAVIDLGQLIRDVCSMMYGEALLSKIAITARLPEKPLLICGSGDKIREVLINLFRNAFQAMPAGGPIAVAAAAGDDAVELTVADTGSGMPPAVMAEIFKPFYTTKETGTGLGLAICRRIMHEHRGEITVSSEEGRGTTFTLTFPQPSCDDTSGKGL